MTSKIVAVLALFKGLASTVNAQSDAKMNAVQGVATYRLWQGDAPGAAGDRESDIPTLTIFRPQPGHENGSAVIIAPGGAYLGLASNLEGRQVADWFAARDTIRAVASKKIRSEPGPDRRYGLLGGRHLAASAATMFEGGSASAADPIERVGSRPDFLILGYPWLNAMKNDEKSGVISYCSVLKIEAGNCAFEQYSPDAHVTAQRRRITAAGVDVEMHLFAKGNWKRPGHGRRIAGCLAGAARNLDARTRAPVTGMTPGPRPEH